ncbi:vitamin D3 hydroxylase-associated protein-like [Ambystoma mexicanum]|uniref:vitamin D3 hydroxylase-associated protein-like n=1 Tax=Ambystoma mexicanum TaxID=8296 RepID=UPI0037E97B2F
MEVPGLEVAHLPALLLGGTAAAVLLVVLRWNRRRRRIQSKIERGRQKKEAALAQMEQAVQRFRNENPGLVPASILSLSLVELTNKLQDGSLSPESAVYTYMGKALEVHRDVNCLTDYLSECEDQLQELKKQKDKGLLYGVPISIKESNHSKGHDSTLGYVQLIDVPSPEDDVLIQVLKKQGAVPFVKTNVPQSLMNYDCSNPIFGQTVHPLNNKKTSGGSSGGEGALISAGGSLLGIGSDIGGSIRLPGAFCGACGLKPTGNRLSTRGESPREIGQKTVKAVFGPLARDVDSLVLCMRALLCDTMFRLDPTVPPIPFNEEVYSSTRPLRVGYFETDGYTMPSPSMRRAVLDMKQLLEKAGHTLVAFTPPRVDFAFTELAYQGLLSDAASALLDTLNDEFVDPNLKAQISFYRIPRLIKTFLSFVTKPLFPRFSYICKSIRGLGSVKELHTHYGDAEEYRLEFIEKWAELNLDVILCPVLSPAFGIGYPARLMTAASYTILYNLLDFPAGVVPVTTVTERDEEELKHYKGYYKDTYDKLFREAVAGSVGLPVGVQCVALPWQEELCLRFMKEVETLAREKN